MKFFYYFYLFIYFIKQKKVKIPVFALPYTIQGAFRSGIYSEHFTIGELIDPNQNKRTSATSGILTDLIEWASFFPGIQSIFQSFSQLSHFN